MREGTPRERVKFWQARDVGNLDLLRATYVTHSFARHTHDGFAIGVIEAGAETFHCRGATWVAPAGSIVVINPGEPHTGQAATRDGWTYRMFYPEACLLQRASCDVTERPCDVPFFASPVIDDQVTAATLRRLHDTLETSTSTLERETRLVDAFSLLVMRHADVTPVATPGGRARALVERMRRYLDECYVENVTLDELSHLVGLSPFHLLRVFRREVGLPPHAYLTGVRVAQAKHLLSTGQPAAEVARAVGFVDQSHLTRHFKRLIGITPGQYLGGARI